MRIGPGNGTFPQFLIWAPCDIAVANGGGGGAETEEEEEEGKSKKGENLKKLMSFPLPPFAVERCSCYSVITM